MNSAIMMLEETAARLGNKPCASDDKEELTFAALRRLALSVATGLMEGETALYGPRPLRPVVVYLPKSVKSLICFAGAMYSGNPYVPVDAAIPTKRLQTILENMGEGHIITDEALMPHLEGIVPAGTKVHLLSQLLQIPPDGSGGQGSAGTDR